MNIQIFGTKKNFDSKKAERYFKERGIKYQFIDMKEKEKKLRRILRIFMTLLTCILIALFFGIMVLVSDMQGTARVVNYAGLVRGKTQQIIKLENAKEPQDEMIRKVDTYIDGLRHGSDELNLKIGRASCRERV